MWGPTRISEANFGAKPPRPPNMEASPLGVIAAYILDQLLAIMIGENVLHLNCI